MMQALELDFVRGRRASPWVGRVLLAAAACVALDAGLAYHAAHSALEANQAAAAKRGRAAAAPKASPQEIAAVRDTVQRLSLPWDTLFGALESAAGGAVTLTAIEPDPRAGTVTISGEAKDYLAALSYVLNLSRAEGLERVQMVRHEQKGDAVSFSASAAWSQK